MSGGAKGTELPLGGGQGWRGATSPFGSDLFLGELSLHTADPSRGLSKVHTPFLMNEPMSCARRVEMGQMSAGNGVKVKFICLQEVRSPYIQSREGGIFAWL